LRDDSVFQAPSDSDSAMPFPSAPSPTSFIAQSRLHTFAVTLITVTAYLLLLLGILGLGSQLLAIQHDLTELKTCHDLPMHITVLVVPIAAMLLCMVTAVRVLNIVPSSRAAMALVAFLTLVLIVADDLGKQWMQGRGPIDVPMALLALPHHLQMIDYIALGIVGITLVGLGFPLVRRVFRGI